MNRRFILGFINGLLIFSAIKLLAAHLASDCGLPAVFGRDAPRHLRPGQVCADDITRAGWPLQFYEEGGFAYRSEFSLSSLLINVGLGVGASAIAGWLYAWRKNGPPKQNLCAIMPPTWNTVCASSTTIITTMTTIPRSLGEALLVNK